MMEKRITNLGEHLEKGNTKKNKKRVNSRLRFCNTLPKQKRFLKTQKLERKKRLKIKIRDAAA
jgi:hypothetical protein